MKRRIRLYEINWVTLGRALDKNPAILMDNTDFEIAAQKGSNGQELVDKLIRIGAKLPPGVLARGLRKVYASWQLRLQHDSFEPTEEGQGYPMWELEFDE